MCGIIIIIYEIIGSTYQHQNISSVRMKSEKLRQLHCPYNKYITTMTTKHTAKKKMGMLNDDSNLLLLCKTYIVVVIDVF